MLNKQNGNVPSGTANGSFRNQDDSYTNQKKAIRELVAMSHLNDAKNLDDANNTRLANNYTINIQQPDNNNAIIVETQYPEKKFMFYDHNKNFLGGFSIYEFIKYVTSHVNVNFLIGIDGNSVKPIIERYICSIKKGRS